MLASDAGRFAMNTVVRRVILARILTLFAWVFVFASIFVLFSDFFGSQAPREGIAVEITQVRAKGAVAVTWQGRPHWVVFRDARSLNNLDRHREALRDPDSRSSEQPAAAQNPGRSIVPDVVVVEALGTHIRCEVEPVFDGDSLSGFTDRCRGWRYDAAGRVFSDQEALRNLRVPPYHIEAGTLKLGEE